MAMAGRKTRCSVVKGGGAEVLETVCVSISGSIACLSLPDDGSGALTLGIGCFDDESVAARPSRLFRGLMENSHARSLRCLQLS